MIDLADQDSAAPDIAGERAFMRELAAAVILQAVRDIQVGVQRGITKTKLAQQNADTNSALEFLFGRGDGCAGWAGVLDCTVPNLRRRIIAALERNRAASAASASLKRAAAGRALQRIEMFRAHDAALAAIESGES